MTRVICRLTKTAGNPCGIGVAPPTGLQHTSARRQTGLINHHSIRSLSMTEPEEFLDESIANAESESPDPSAQRQEEFERLDPLRRLEAVLFLSREPLHSRKLSQLAGLSDGTQARSLVRELNREYDRIGRAFAIKQVAGGFQMRTRPMFATWLQKIRNSPSAVRLSGPAMETLAVVAYRQPVLKADVEAIRGVSCGELLRQLLDRGMVRITGRSTELGNPFLYGTTRRFLEVFGLASIEALPRGKKLRGKGLPDWSTTAAPEIAQSENPAKTALNPLDESDTNSQNVVDLDTSPNSNDQKTNLQEE